MVADTSSLHVSVIAPTAYLRDFVAQEPATVHHVAAQRVLHEPAYRSFFRAEADRGAWIVVDNGVFDLGRALEAPDLVQAARMIGAHEIILPDVRQDGPATTLASDRAARRLLDLTDDLNLCAVVHGADGPTWLRCYEHFATSSYVSAIALPASRRHLDSRELCQNRVRATAYLADQGLVQDRLTYRLLGLGRTGHLELTQQTRHRWLSSVDCAAPVILGAMGVPMLPDGPYTKIHTPRIDALDPIDPRRFPLIRANIATVRRAAHCPLTIPEDT
ncbi:MAG TPA: hypothetical protein VI248_20580 [Kineosporiaceae bacterium]